MNLEVDETVALVVVLMVSLLLVVVPAGSGEVLLVLVLIGLLVVRALAHMYAPAETTSGLDGFIGVGLVAFGLIVVRRVFEILIAG